MRQYLTTPITTNPTLGQPFKQGTAVFLQQAYQEILDVIGIWIINNILSPGIAYSPSRIYNIFGNTTTTVGSTLNIAAGAVFFQGQFYLSNAASVPAIVPPGQSLVGNITNSYYIDPTADPITMSDGITTANVHQIQTITWANQTTGTGNFPFSALFLTDTLTPTINSLSNRISTLETEIAVGAWINIGAGGSTYGANWATNAETAKFTKDGEGRVYFSGAIAHTGSSTSDSTMFTLPVGYRPSQRVIMNVPCSTIVAPAVQNFCISIGINGVVDWSTQSGNLVPSNIVSGSVSPSVWVCGIPSFLTL